VIGDACFHRWRNAKRLVNPEKIVMHKMQRDGVLMILQLF